MMTTPEIHLRRRLHALRLRMKRIAFLRGVILWVALALALGQMAAGLESLFWFSSSVRTALLVLCFLALSAGATVFLVLPAISLIFKKKTPDDVTLALMVGERYSHLKDRLADALQVMSDEHGRRFGTSNELAVAAVEAVSRLSREIPFQKIISYQIVWRPLGMLALLFLLAWSGAGRMSGGWHRLVHPLAAFQKPIPFEFQVLPGHCQLLAGEDLTLEVRLYGEAPRQIVFAWKQEGDGFFEKRGASFRFIDSLSCHSASVTLPHLRRSLNYRVDFGRVKSKTYHVQVVHTPRVRTLNLTVTPPPYTGMAATVLEENVGDVQGLKGSRVQITLDGGKILSRAALHFESGRRVPLTISDNQARGLFRLWKKDRYSVVLTDTSGYENSHPIEYDVNVRPDLYPRIRLLLPGKDIDLDESMHLDLRALAEDDFGLSRARLGFWVKKGGDEEAPMDTLWHELPFGPGALITYLWNLDSLSLFPEDVLHYIIRVWDNDAVSGPKFSTSQIFRARFPSFFEIFQEAEEAHSQQRASLESVEEESREIEEALTRAVEEMQRGKKMEWEDRRALESLSRRQQELHQRMENLEQDLEQMVDKLDDNHLIDPETLDKYMELQELYQEIASPEMQEAMRQLQQMSMELTPQQLEEAVKNMQINQESFRKSIERTLSLLKRLQVEQKTQEIVQRLDDLVERQQKMNQSLSSEESRDLSNEIRESQKMERDTESLEGSLQELQNLMEETPGMPLSDLNEMMQQMQKDSLSQRQKSMQGSMRSGQQSAALQMGQQSLEKMMSLSEQMKSIDKKMKRDDKRQVMEALSRASRRMLQLSRKQEALRQAMQDGRMTPREGGRQQYSLMNGVKQVTDSLMSLGQKTFAVTPQMGQAMGQAMARMQEVLNTLQNRGGGSPSRGQQEAMGALNRGAMALQEAMNQMGGASSGLGMDQFMMQMGASAQQQMALNRQTLDMMNRGGMSLTEQAAMSRLAGRQTAIRQAVEEAVESLGERSDMAGRLDRMIEEMKETARELENGEVSRETIQRQQRILSRLLDAQNSVRKRDYSRRREAITGQDRRRAGPKALDLDRRNAFNVLDENILHLPEEGYTPLYQMLIRQYLESLRSENPQEADIKPIQ